MNTIVSATGSQNAALVQNSSDLTSRLQKLALENVDAKALGAFKNLFEVLGASKERQLVVSQQAQARAEMVMPQLKERIRNLIEDNQKLNAQLVEVESQLKQVKMVHKAVEEALVAKANAAEAAAKAARAEATEAILKAEKRVAMAIAEKVAAVKAATDMGNARVTAIQQTVQAKDAQIEVLREQLTSTTNEFGQSKRRLASHEDLIERIMCRFQLSVKSHAYSEQGYVQRFGSNHHLAIHHRIMQIGIKSSLDNVVYYKKLLCLG